MEPKGYSQLPLGNHGDAAKVALHLDSKGDTVFFALASFKETYVNDFQQHRVKRTRTNVDKLKALWLDIDFKVAGGLPDALNSLASFLKTTGFAKPTAIVHSGNGIHVYWALTKSIPLGEWLPLANAFKALCQKHDLPADHMCTADASRVLRPPGTHNRKAEALPVTILKVDPHQKYEPDGLMKMLPGTTDKTTSVPAHLQGLVTTNEFSAATMYDKRVSKNWYATAR